MKYAIALDVSQAQRLVKNNVVVDQVISFCPAASKLLIEKDYQVVSAASHYGALSHAKAVVLIDKDLKRLKPALQQQYNLSESEARNVSVYLFHFFCLAYYIYFVSRHYRHETNGIIWVDKAGAVKHGDYSAMYLELVEQARIKITSYSNTQFSYPHYLLAIACNAILGFALRLKKKKTILDFGDVLPKKVINAMMDEGNTFVVLASRKMSKNMYKTLHFFAKSLKNALSTPRKNRPVCIFRAANPSGYHVQVEKPHITMRYTPLQQATEAAIIAYIPFLKTEFPIGQKLVDDFRPNIIISDYAKYPYVLAAQERQKQFGGLCIMMNHGSHTVQQSPISAIAAPLWASQDRVITDFVTDHAPKSPLTLSMVEQICPQGGYRLHKLSPFQEIKKHPTPDDEFMVLHAGNFTDAYNHIPWCKETSDEYLLGVYELLEEMQTIEGVKLIIKLKAQKAKAHVELVQAYIDKLGIGHKTIVDTSSRFADLLEKASMVVSNLSGTVEEALINHIPVLVHTYHKCYFHIPPEVLNPAGLNPAYLATERGSFKQILEFAKANRSALFNPGLYENVAWKKEEIVDMRTFARDIIKEVEMLQASAGRT